MGIFNSIKEKVIEKKQQMDERREFLNRVEEESKPFRRTAYMNQMMKEAVKEGIARAKIDAAAKLPKPRTQDSDLGIMRGLEDPYKFINKQEVNQNGKIIQKEGKTNTNNSTRRGGISRGTRSRR